MKCPHCLVEIHAKFISNQLDIDSAGYGWRVLSAICPNTKCGKPIIKFERRFLEYSNHPLNREVVNEHYIWPKKFSRPIPPEVPEDFAKDYREASLILNDSPQASAALSRRCLQHIIHQARGVKKRNLEEEINEIITKDNIPSYIADQLHAIRQIGNFAAHPQKDINTGEILPVEEGEAEWTLDVLDSLFDFYFVQPAAAQTKKDALNLRLQQAGKPVLS